jgi:hypothetical protein
MSTLSLSCKCWRSGACILLGRYHTHGWRERSSQWLSNHTTDPRILTLCAVYAVVGQAAYEQIDFAALEADVQETQAVCALTQSPIVFGHCEPAVLSSACMLWFQQFSWSVWPSSAHRSQNDSTCSKPCTFSAALVPEWC